MTRVEVRAGEIARHHRSRTAEVGEVLRADPDATVWAVAQRVRWGGGFASLAPGRLISALRQTAWHIELAGGPPPAGSATMDGCPRPA